MTTTGAEIAGEKSVWRTWWNRLQEDRGGRAELRRCGSVAEAALCATFHLLRSMRGNPQAEEELKNLGLIAVALSHVDEDDPRAGSLARMMAAPQGEKAVVSDVRFRQILRTDDCEFDERLVGLIRILRQLGGKAHVHRLATDLSRWNEKTRIRWALEYYEHAPVLKKASD